MTSEEERRAAWAKLDEPIKAVIFARLDAVLASALASEAWATASSATTRSAMRMFVEGEVQRARVVGASDEDIAEAFGAGSSAAMVFAGLEAEHERQCQCAQRLRDIHSAARMVLCGEGMEAWRSRGDIERAYVIAELCVEHAKAIVRNKKTELDATGMAIAAGLVAGISDMVGGSSTSMQRGFQVGHGSSVLASNTIVEAFQAALNLLFDGEG